MNVYPEAETDTWRTEALVGEWAGMTPPTLDDYSTAFAILRAREAKPPPTSTYAVKKIRTIPVPVSVVAPIRRQAPQRLWFTGDKTSETWFDDPNTVVHTTAPINVTEQYNVQTNDPISRTDPLQARGWVTSGTLQALQGLIAASPATQMYPTWRYHPERPPRIVNNVVEDNTLTPQSAGWRDRPFATPFAYAGTSMQKLLLRLKPDHTIERLMISSDAEEAQARAAGWRDANDVIFRARQLLGR